MEVYAADCARVGVDYLEAAELRYRRGLARPPSAITSFTKRRSFLSSRSGKARPEPAPMRVVAAFSER